MTYDSKYDVNAQGMQKEKQREKSDVEPPLVLSDDDQNEKYRMDASQDINGSPEASVIFDEESVRMFFRRLNHHEYGLTELVIIHPEKDVLATGFFSDENAFVNACSQWNDRGNVYAGRNPRPFDFASRRGLELNWMYTDKKIRAKDKDIEYVTSVSLDIDPSRETNTSSTDAQHKMAIELAEKIAADIEGDVDDSGNGAYVWIQISPIRVDDENRETIRAKCKAWEAGIRDRYKPDTYGMTIDSVFELSRIKKVIGTLSIKGKVHRLSRFHKRLMIKQRTSLDQEIMNIDVKPDKILVPVNAININDPLPQSFQYLLDNDKALRKHWDTPHKTGDTSKHDFRLGMMCLSRGIIDSMELAAILIRNPNGKTVKWGLDKRYLELIIPALIAKQEDPVTKIDNIWNEGNPDYITRRNISDFVFNDLKNRGRFIKADGKSFYFFTSKKKLMEIPNSLDFIAILNNIYGLVATEKETQYVLNDLKSKCYEYGEKASVYQYAFFDKCDFRLYIDKFDGGMYVLNGRDITLKYNGEDNVLFLHDAVAEPYEIDTSAKGGLFHKHIILKINFDLADGNMSEKDQRMLFRTWLWQIFFESLAPTKPILLLFGPKGSGKTATARAIGKLLFGRDFDVSSVGENPRDFDVLITNRYFVILDNLDERREWLNDRLAKIATGQVIEVRELYTTNSLARYKPRCFVVITARTPQDRRDDIADRLLILNVARFETFIPESRLMEDIIQNRNEILSGLFKQLNWCIRMLKANENMHYMGKFRMADFADFGYKLYNGSDAFIKALEKMDEKQNEFLLEEDPFIELLDEWLENPSNVGRDVTAMELISDLNLLAMDKLLDFRYKSPKALSMRLRHQEKNLQQYYDFQIVKRAGNKNLFQFKKKQ